MAFVMILVGVLLTLIRLYAALCAASYADDWSERMQDEQRRQRQTENNACADRDHPGSGTGEDVWGAEVQRPGKLENR